MIMKHMKIAILMITAPLLMAPGGGGEGTPWTTRMLHQQQISNESREILLQSPDSNSANIFAHFNAELVVTSSKDGLGNPLLSIALNYADPELDDAFEDKLWLQSEPAETRRGAVSENREALQKKYDEDLALAKRLRSALRNGIMAATETKLSYEYTGQQLIGGTGKHIVGPVCIRRLIRNRTFSLMGSVFTQSVGLELERRNLPLEQTIDDCLK